MVPLVQAETGAIIGVAAGAQVPGCSNRLYEYADLALEDWDVPLPPSSSGLSQLGPSAMLGAIAIRQPVGVCGCITPYNFPLTSVAGKIGPALAMGNTVIIKPAPQDPLGIIEMVKVFEEVGFPPGVINVVTGSRPEVGAALVDSPDVDMISFTGSSVVGSKIFEAGGKTMKRLLMELGGKGAALVLHDADIADRRPEHLERLGIPLRADLHRPHPGGGPPLPLPGAGRRTGPGGPGPPDRRPARPDHGGRPGDLGHPA